MRSIVNYVYLEHYQRWAATYSTTGQRKRCWGDCHKTTTPKIQDGDRALHFHGQEEINALTLEISPVYT